MPEKKTIERARRDKAEGKAPSTQAGEFVREEIEHVREGQHGARSSRQAGLSPRATPGESAGAVRRAKHPAGRNRPSGYRPVSRARTACRAH